MGTSKASDSANNPQSPDVKKTLRDRLIGGWRLDSYVETNAETKVETQPFGASPRGFILYTPDGFVSAQCQPNKRAAFSAGDMFSGEPQEYVEAGRTYLAYAGRYSVDEATSRVFHDVEVSFFPNWTGVRQVRLVAIENENLTLAFEKPLLSNGALKSATIKWKRSADCP